jgi:hypothetical protein
MRPIAMVPITTPTAIPVPMLKDAGVCVSLSLPINCPLKTSVKNEEGCVTIDSFLTNVWEPCLGWLEKPVEQPYVLIYVPGDSNLTLVMSVFNVHVRSHRNVTITA